MRGIILKDSIKLFGFKTGFSFWFRWSFVDPLEHFIWLNITHKPYCLYAGWHCNNENCNHKHLTTKKEILKEFEKHEKESKTIRAGPKGECVYCGEESGTEIIDDPNWDTIERWKVCKICKEIIEIQQETDMLRLLPTKEAEERLFTLNNRLLEIEKQTGKRIFSTTIQRNDKGGYSKIDT